MASAKVRTYIHVRLIFQEMFVVLSVTDRCKHVYMWKDNMDGCVLSNEQEMCNVYTAL